MEEGHIPPVFNSLNVPDAVQLNIYAIRASENESLLKQYQSLILKHLDLPDDFWKKDEESNWRNESILTLGLREQYLRMTRNDLTVSHVPLAPDGTSKGGEKARLFVLSPLLKVERMHGFVDGDQDLPKRKTKMRKKTDKSKEEIDIDDWLDEALAEDEDGATGHRLGDKRAIPTKKKTINQNGTSKRAISTRKKPINQKGSITVESYNNGRFPELSPALRQFNAFVLAVDSLAKRLLQQDRRAFDDLELMATYHTHISKSDAYSSTRYKQSLEELENEYSEQPLSDCSINIKIKGAYIARTCQTPEGGIWKAPLLDTIEHLPRVFDSSKYVQSNLEELVGCGRNCYVQFLFHLGQLYERQATGRSGDDVYRGITLPVFRIVFWPVEEALVKRCVGKGNLWDIGKSNSSAPTTSYYAVTEGNSSDYVVLDEYGLPIRK